MADGFLKFDFALENEEEFVKAIERISENITDFRIPFGLVMADWEKSNKQIFQLKSRGQYQDLSTKPFRAFWDNRRGVGALYEGGYKEYKKINIGFAYPILVGESGRLAASMLNRSAQGAIRTVTESTLVMGTKIKYAKYHQLGTGKMPQRKFNFIDDARLRRWLGILNNYARQVINQEGFGS